MAAGLIERSHRVTAIANKAGLFGYHESADSQLTTTIRMADGSSSGWAGQPSTKLSEIDSANLAATAIEKCLRWKNPQKLEPGNYTVVLEPTAAGDLVRLMAGAFSARNTEEGRTFLSKRGGGTLLGEKVFPEFITLRSDPFDPRQPSSPWTGDLLPTRAITWVDKGVVANLAYDRYWAEKDRQAAHAGSGGFGGGGGGGFGGGGGGSLIMEGGDASTGSTDRLGGARPADHAFLVHPRRESADAATNRPDARRSVSDRERKDHDAGDELPLPGKPGAAVEEHEKGGAGGARAGTRRRNDDRAGAGSDGFSATVDFRRRVAGSQDTRTRGGTWAAAPQDYSPSPCLSGEGFQSDPISGPLNFVVQGQSVTLTFASPGFEPSKQSAVLQPGLRGLVGNGVEEEEHSVDEKAGG